MGTIKSSTLLNKAQTILQDATETRWPITELLGWLNDGQREIVLLKPDANTSSGPESLVASIKQTLPAGGILFIDILSNTTGQVVKQIAREHLDAQLPNWRNAPASATIKYFMFDPRNPKEFHVYPKATTDASVELVYAVTPTDMVGISNTIALDDIYANVLVDYVLYRAFSKDADFAGNGQRAMAAYGTFAQALGLKGSAAVAAA